MRLWWWWHSNDSLLFSVWLTSLQSICSIAQAAWRWLTHLRRVGSCAHTEYVIISREQLCHPNVNTNAGCLISNEELFLTFFPFFSLSCILEASCAIALLPVKRAQGLCSASVFSFFFEIWRPGRLPFSISAGQVKVVKHAPKRQKCVSEFA